MSRVYEGLWTSRLYFLRCTDFFRLRYSECPFKDGLKAAKEALQIFRQLGLKKFQAFKGFERLF